LKLTTSFDEEKFGVNPLTSKRTSIEILNNGWLQIHHKYTKCIFSSIIFFEDSCIRFLIICMVQLLKTLNWKYSISQLVLVDLASKSNLFNSNNESSKMTWIK